jgi:hypothetical protein
MKQNHFYSHLITLESIHIALNDLDLEVHEREELLTFAETTLHHTVLDIVLTELPAEEKKKFLSNVHTNDHEAVWLHIKQHIEEVEEKIKAAAKQLEATLHQDIKEVKKK